MGDELADSLVLSSADERTELGAGIKPASDRNASCALDQPLQQSIRDALLYDQARCRTTDLALIPEDSEHDPFDGSLDVGVVEHDERRFTTEFEADVLDILRGSHEDFRAGRDRAGEGDLVDAWMVRQALPRHGTKAGDKVENPAGSPASTAISASFRLVSDVNSEGFSTMVQPAAMAGATFQAAISNG